MNIHGILCTANNWLNASHRILSTPRHKESAENLDPACIWAIFLSISVPLYETAWRSAWKETFDQLIAKYHVISYVRRSKVVSKDLYPYKSHPLHLQTTTRISNLGSFAWRVCVAGGPGSDCLIHAMGDGHGCFQGSKAKGSRSAISNLCYLQGANGNPPTSGSTKFQSYHVLKPTQVGCANEVQFKQL